MAEREWQEYFEQSQTLVTHLEGMDKEVLCERINDAVESLNLIETFISDKETIQTLIQYFLSMLQLQLLYQQEKGRHYYNIQPATRFHSGEPGRPRFNVSRDHLLIRHFDLSRSCLSSQLLISQGARRMMATLQTRNIF